MSNPENVSRRTALLGLGATGVAAIGAGAAPVVQDVGSEATPRNARVSSAEIR